MNRAIAILFMCLLAAGCGQNMTSQPKYSEYQPAPLFSNGRVVQAPVPGTVARGDLDRAREAAEPPPLTAALLARGRERFDVFCSPCHARTGEGDGMVVRRGMPRPLSFHDPRLRAAPDRHFFDVITGGYGAMYSYASRVPPADRWAIVAYIRALQLSQNASLDDVPPEERARLLAQAPP
jgi:mono/diheme cytochrome c family protein